MSLQSFLQSKMFKRILIGIGVLIILLLIFKAGEAVGHRRKGFFRHQAGDYYGRLGRPRWGFFSGIGSRDFSYSHGATGSIISVSGSTLTLQTKDNSQQAILLTKDTIIRQFRNTISVNDLKAGDQVVVIGSPNDAGEVEAKFIRVMAQPSFFSSPTTTLQ